MTKDNRELYLQLQELFDIAWDLNMKKKTPTELSQKVTTFLPAIMQNFSHYCDLGENTADMRRVAWEEGFNQGYIKGVMMAVKNGGRDNDEI